MLRDPVRRLSKSWKPLAFLIQWLWQWYARVENKPQRIRTRVGAHVGKWHGDAKRNGEDIPSGFVGPRPVEGHMYFRNTCSRGGSKGRATYGSRWGPDYVGHRRTPPAPPTDIPGARCAGDSSIWWIEVPKPWHLPCDYDHHWRRRTPGGVGRSWSSPKEDQLAAERIRTRGVKRLSATDGPFTRPASRSTFCTPLELLGTRGRSELTPTRGAHCLPRSSLCRKARIWIGCCSARLLAWRSPSSGLPTFCGRRTSLFQDSYWPETLRALPIFAICTCLRCAFP